MAPSTITLAYKNDAADTRPGAMTSASLWAEPFEDKWARIAKSRGPFDHLVFRNKSTANATIYLNGSRTNKVIVPANDSFSSSVTPYTYVEVVVDANADAGSLIMVPRRVAG